MGFHTNFRDQLIPKCKQDHMNHEECMGHRGKSSLHKKLGFSQILLLDQGLLHSAIESLRKK